MVGAFQFLGKRMQALFLARVPSAGVKALKLMRQVITSLMTNEANWLMRSKQFLNSLEICPPRDKGEQEIGMCQLKWLMGLSLLTFLFYSFYFSNIFQNGKLMKRIDQECRG